MTIVIALLVIPFIPDYPGTKRWWLEEDHQILAVSAQNIALPVVSRSLKDCLRTGGCRTRMLVWWTMILSP